MTNSTIRAFTCLIVLPAVSLLFGFTDTGPEQQKVLIAEMPLYLEEHNRVPGAPNEFWSMREAGEYAHIPYDEEYNVKSRS